MIFMSYYKLKENKLFLKKSFYLFIDQLQLS